MLNPQILKHSNIMASSPISLQLQQQQQGNRPLLYLSNNEKYLKEIVASNNNKKMKNKNWPQTSVTNSWINKTKADIKSSLSNNKEINIQNEEKKKKKAGNISNLKSNLNMNHNVSKNLENILSLPCKTEGELTIKNKSLLSDGRYDMFPSKPRPKRQLYSRVFQFDFNDPVFSSSLQGENFCLIPSNDGKKDEHHSPNHNSNMALLNGINNTSNIDTNNSISVCASFHNPYNNFHSSLYSQRHQLYYDFIETINFSNMMLYIIPMKFKPMQSYKYCVVKGNNHLLILKALKKRSKIFNFYE